jgi:hypothetical protein
MHGHRRVIVLAIVATILCGAAPVGSSAAPQGVNAAFGNTVRTTYPDGRHQRFWLQPGGHWDAVGRRGKPSSGRWTSRGEKLCFKQTRPLPLPMTYCADFPNDAKVGSEWASKDAGGTPVRVSLVKGASRP